MKQTSRRAKGASTHQSVKGTNVEAKQKSLAKVAANGAQVISVERALTILELLSERQQGLTTSDLSRRAHIPKSSTSYLLRTLVARGYVRRDVATGQHTLGVRLLSLGGKAMQGMELRAVAMPHLRHIVERTRLGAHLAVIDHGDAVYIERIEAPGFIKMAIWIGRRTVPQITAVGKALICHLDQHDLQEIVALSHDNPAARKTTLTLPQLFTELAATRQRGYAVDDEESEIGVRCVAAPVFAASGEVVAALGVSGVVNQISNDYIPTLGSIIRTAALKLSAQLGSRNRR